jgi:hypothetical protein
MDGKAQGTTLRLSILMKAKRFGPKTARGLTQGSLEAIA